MEKLSMSKRKSIYGLVGYPVEHSLSPLMHNTAFKELGVHAVYELFPLKENALDVFFEDIKEKESPIFGLNVTVPYKEKALKYLDTKSPFAEKVGAINTIVISEDRKLTGYNTDGPGFLAHLTELKFNPAQKRVSLLGAGGAARAVVSVLCLIPEQPSVIKIFDMDKQKAHNLVEDLSRRMDTRLIKIVNNISELDIASADLVINATPVGLKESDPCLVDENLFHNNMLVYDLIYNPAETKLLKGAVTKGAKVSNGLGMLYYQGVLAFQHWAGMEITQKVKDKMRRALEEGLKK
ncbi:MAG: shikimate dehydrogenase [Candidatus Omnitrophica bacterium]|nr:shikimate dehydrogenase [Candidatus Omnitrophota bacterium]